jgi:small conductance mechanosensitive channel
VPWLQRLSEFFNVEAVDVARALIRLAGIWLIAWVCGRVVRFIANRIVKSVDDGDDAHLSIREKRGQTVAQLLRSIGRVVITLVAIMLSLDIFFDIGPILAGAGILGLAISFGAQSLVKDIISGFFILLENQFAVGDVIETAGKSGTVERMTLRVVMLRDLRGVLHIIPNGQMTVVSNQTRGWARAVVEVGIGYSVDVDHALEVFRDEASAFGKDPDWKLRLDGPPEVLGIESLADSAVLIRTLLRTLPGEQWAAAREFRRRLKARLDKEGIEIPYPQRTVHVRPQGAQLS